MSTNLTRASARAWYDRQAPLLFAVIAILALVGIWIGTVSSLTNARQDAERAAEAEVRDKEQRALLACFDEYAQAQSGASVAVREASAMRDEAQVARDEALRELVAVIVANATKPPTDLEAARAQFIDLATALRDTSRDLKDAVAALTQAREDNPVPAPPSEFCSVAP